MSDKVSAEAPAADLVERLRNIRDYWAPDRVAIAAEGADEITALRAEIERLTAALPDGMEHCKIVFEECPVGHGHLRGDNWLKKDCQRCRVLELEAENTELREELDTWKSVFPDIAPASVLPDRSLLEADNARLRRALKWYEEQTRLINGTPDEVEKAYPTLASDSGKIARAALKEKTASDYGISLENPAIALTQEPRT